MRIAARLVFLFFSTALLSQLDHPKASPAATVSQVIGFATIQIDYSRPAARGRKIFGDLVPFGRIWRVGANESTKFSIDTEVSVLGNQLLAGTYALYAFPEPDEWEIVFHKNIEHWGDGRKGYNPEEDAFRVTVKSQKIQSYQENFLIAFDSISHSNANLIWQWEKTKISIPISVDTHRIMEMQIAEKLVDNPSAQTYYEAARYYVEQGVKFETALAYLNKALELGGDTYFFHRVKSLAEAELGDYKAAITSAQKSLELAQEQAKDEFVRMNQKNIDLWKRKP
jgi:tetratricopeptide (TPR) repeat protein